MTKIVRTQVVEGWTLGFATDEEPRIRDFDLAEKLGVGRPRKVRDLIRRHAAAGNISPFAVCTTPVQTGGRPGTEYWLSESDALFIATQSGTTKAVALTKEMIRVFLAVRHGQLRELAQAAGLPASSDLRNNAEFATQCRGLLHSMARACGLSFQAAHGSLRRSFHVPSYRYVRTSDWPVVRDWLIDRLSNPVVPVRLLLERQSTFDEYVRRRQAEH